MTTGISQGSGRGERFGNKAGGRNLKGHIVVNRREGGPPPPPRPQTSASVPVKPSLPLKLFLSDQFSPVCSEACLPGVAG